MADLTHLDARGEAHMVDVGRKPDTARRALATALAMNPHLEFEWGSYLSEHRAAPAARVPARSPVITESG